MKFDILPLLALFNVLLVLSNAAPIPADISGHLETRSLWHSLKNQLFGTQPQLGTVMWGRIVSNKMLNDRSDIHKIHQGRAPLHPGIITDHTSKGMLGWSQVSSKKDLPKNIFPYQAPVGDIVPSANLNRGA